MKIATILIITGFIMYPIVGLSQTSETLVSPTQSATTTAAQQSADVFPPKTVETSARCGVNSYKFYNECGAGLYLYKNIYAQCFDGFEVTLGGETSCETYETWTQSANDACANHCDVPQSLQKPIMPVIPETAVPAPTPESTTPTTTTFGGNTGGGGGAISTTPITPTITPQTTAVSPPQTKCGVNSSAVFNECGAGVYKNVFAQCYDGFEVTLGETTSCKPAELWNQYAKEACVNHCSNGNGSGVVSEPLPQPTVQAPVIHAGDDVGGGNRSTPLIPLPPMSEQKWISVCYMSDKLMQQYNELILELQKVSSDKIKAEEIIRQIVALKQYIEAQEKACATDPQAAWQVAAPPTVSENKPVAVSIDRCNEVAQWETKIIYYKKLSGLGDADLKKEGFSREEIEKITQELSSGIEKIRVQCSGQEKAPAITGSAAITEAVKPVVTESGQEISVYYKARIEKAVSVKGEEKQIEELKTLRDEIDGLISNLIKSRKELEVSELNTLVKEVKISRGEIKADDITVKTTEKKMLINVGDRPVSIEPTESRVLIRDKGLEVNASEVMIKENVLSVGGADVKMSASEVTEKLGLVPTTIELREEDAKAVYNMTIEERRKLFGFIPFNSQKTITVDADDGNTLSEQLPWYNFLTTK